MIRLIDMISGILLLVGVLMIVVVIHELGHYWAAKLFKVRVEEFGIGLPPKVFKLFSRGETEFTLNALPIGGFVRMYGENGETRDGIPDNRAFWYKPVWQKVIILVGGVFMNFVLGFVIFTAVYSYLGIPVESQTVKIVGVEKGSPAESAGLKMGDEILEISSGEEKVTADTRQATSDFLFAQQGKNVELLIKREGKEEKIKVTLREDKERKIGALGVILDNTELKHFPFWEMPFRASWFGIQETVAWTSEIAGSLKPLFARLMIGQLPKEVSGPVGIYSVTRQAWDQGFIVFAKWIGILSINLGVINLIPFPILDGGRVIMVILEKIIGRKAISVVENTVYTISALLMFSFMILITVNDLTNYQVGKRLWEMLFGS